MYLSKVSVMVIIKYIGLFRRIGQCISVGSHIPRHVILCCMLLCCACRVLTIAHIFVAIPRRKEKKLKAAMGLRMGQSRSGGLGFRGA